MAEPLIRAASAADLSALLQLKADVFPADPWGGGAFLAFSTLVAEVDASIVGFLVYQRTFAGDLSSPAEIEILELAVPHAFRRQGIASRLLTCLLQEHATFFLEVRESNCGAQELYRRFGFQQIGRRPGYYKTPEESALVMQLKKC